MNISSSMVYRIVPCFGIRICLKEVLSVFPSGKSFIVPDGNWDIAWRRNWLTREFRKFHQFNAFSCFTPTQVALAAFLKNPRIIYLFLVSCRRKEIISRNCMSATRFKALPTHGSYFQIYSYEDISDKPDAAFAKNLVARSRCCRNTCIRFLSVRKR